MILCREQYPIVGNLIEYSGKLKLRIGVKRFNELEENRHKELVLSVEEVKELIRQYSMKVRAIC